MEKVILREEKVTEAYAYVGRKSKARLVQENLDLLEKERAHWQTPVAQAFLAYLTERLREGKPVGEFIKLEDQQRTGNLILALGALEDIIFQVFHILKKLFQILSHLIDSHLVQLVFLCPDIPAEKNVQYDSDYCQRKYNAQN